MPGIPFIGSGLAGGFVVVTFDRLTVLAEAESSLPGAGVSCDFMRLGATGAGISSGPAPGEHCQIRKRDERDRGARARSWLAKLEVMRGCHRPARPGISWGKPLQR